MTLAWQSVGWYLSSAIRANSALKSGREESSFWWDRGSACDNAGETSWPGVVSVVRCKLQAMGVWHVYEAMSMKQKADANLQLHWMTEADQWQYSVIVIAPPTCNRKCLVLDFDVLLLQGDQGSPVGVYKNKLDGRMCTPVQKL